jgi:GNAT superfamily N-acetyltransferase
VTRSIVCIVTSVPVFCFDTRADPDLIARRDWSWRCSMDGSGARPLSGSDETARVLEPHPGYPLVIAEAGADTPRVVALVDGLIERADFVSLAVLLDSTDRDRLESHLRRRGFEHHDDEVRVDLDLTSWEQTGRSPEAAVQWENHPQAGDSAFLRVARACTGVERLREEEGLEALKGDGFDPRLWEVMVCGGESAGMHLSGIDTARVGTIAFLCVTDGFRGRRLGRHLHARALILLRTHGAIRYRGGTSARNEAMRAIFRANGCPEVARKCVFVRPGGRT